MTKVLDNDLFIEEFKTEAEEFLSIAEQKLIEIEKGASLSSVYDIIFRSFHSLKGASGMLGLDQLQNHVHQLENFFQSSKVDASLSIPQVSFFLLGIDVCRKIINDENFQFDYVYPNKSSSEENQRSLTPKIQTQENLKVKEESLIYVIDDERDIVEILTDIISDAGFKVKGFSDSIQAVKSLKEFNPHAVITDMTMPGYNGLEVLQKVHEFNPEIPVIFVSGNLTKEVLINSLSFGVFSAIEKPFKEPNIISVCNAAVQRFKLSLLLTRSMNFVLYQFSALEDYLTQVGQIEIRNLMVKEVESLLEIRRQLKQVKEKKI